MSYIHIQKTEEHTKHPPKKKTLNILKTPKREACSIKSAAGSLTYTACSSRWRINSLCSVFGWGSADRWYGAELRLQSHDAFGRGYCFTRERERQSLTGSRREWVSKRPAHELLRKSYDSLTCSSSFVLFTEQDETRHEPLETLSLARTAKTLINSSLFLICVEGCLEILCPSD